MRGRVSKGRDQEFFLRPDVKAVVVALIFAFTSSSEGFPNVIGEALSSGLPVISYDCAAGPAEMIKDGENGFLTPVFDDILFQKRLQSLIDNEGLRNRMSENARRKIREFSIDKIGAEYYSFIVSGN